MLNVMQAIAYIDPGTGSMLFTIAIGLIGAAIYSLRGLITKLKFVITGGKVEGIEKRSRYVIFAESGRYWNVFKPICDVFEARKIKVEYLTTDEKDPVFKAGYKYIEPEFLGEGNKAFAKLNMLKADVVLATTPGLDVYQWKRSRDVKYYVHIPHGANDIAGYRMFGIDYYDAILLSGEYQKKQVRELERMRKLPKKDLALTGVTYMDSMLERKAKTKPVKNKKPVVLVSPSWGPSGLLHKYGSKLLDQLLETGYHVIVRPHPQSLTSEKDMIDKLKKKYPDSKQLEWDFSRDNFDTLNRSDVMISDFSGVMFDFTLVFDKPLIYTDVKFDKSPYDYCWLKDEDIWTFSAIEKMGRKLDDNNMKDVKKLIDDCMKSDKYAKARETARQETWVYPGDAARRTANFLIRKRKALAEEKKK